MATNGNIFPSGDDNADDTWTVSVNIGLCISSANSYASRHKMIITPDCIKAQQSLQVTTMAWSKDYWDCLRGLFWIGVMWLCLLFPWVNLLNGSKKCDRARIVKPSWFYHIANGYPQKPILKLVLSYYY